jgi:putative ABC transport system permease protein
VVDAIVFRPLPFRDPGRLVEIADGAIHNQASLVIARDFSRVADYASCGDPAEANLTGHGQPARVVVSSVSGNLFDVLGVSPLRGRSFSRDDEKPGRDTVALISYTLWRDRFNSDASILGRTVRLDDTVRTIVGVMPVSFRFPSPSVQLWTPAVFDSRDTGTYWWAYTLTLVGRLHSGTTLPAAQSELRQLVPLIRGAFPWKMWPDWGVQSRVVALQEALTEGARRRLLLLLGSVLAVLVIACTNLASLMLARGVARRREIATRTSLGAGRWRILRQLFTEGLVLAALGAAAGVLLAFAAQALLLRAVPSDAPQINPIAINARVLWFAAVAAVATAFAFSAGPALLLLKNSLHGTVHAAERVTASGTSSVLAIVEIALAVVLVCGAALMGRSLWVLSGMSTGFRSDHLLTAQISPNESTCRSFRGCNQFYAEALALMRAMPGVELASAANVLPLAGQFSAFSAELQGHPQQPGHSSPMLWMTSATPDYLRAMGIPILRGRGFSNLDTATAEPVILVSAATAAKWWPGQDAIGMHIRPSWVKSWRKVIGVVPDIRALAAGQWFGPMEGQVYIPYAQPLNGDPDPVMSLVLRVTGDPLMYSQEVHRRVAALAPDVPVTNIRTMDELVAASLATPRSMLWLLLSFAVLALTLGVAGIYSVVSWNVSRRVPEIGIRMALGATPAAVTRMVLRQTLVIAVAGVAAGTAGAFMCSRLVTSMVYGVNPRDPAIYIFAAGILFATGLLAGYVPARRAARIDPVSVLRCD